MGNVHFSGRNRDIPSHVLNSRHNNVLEDNNIRFHIDGQYLSDFSDKGIKDFIHKNYNKNTGFLGFMGVGWGGKDLDFKEVKAFIQAAAANADKLQGKTFELTDPELGLFNNDDIKVKDIKHSFDLKYTPSQGSSDPSVSFVDVKEVRYHHREATQAENSTKKTYQTEQKHQQTLQNSLNKATQERDKIAKRIGNDAVRKLAEIDGRISGLDNQLKALDTDMHQAKMRLSQSHVPESERRELRLMVRGMEAERKELQDERKGLQKSLTKNHGFWSFLGGGSNLEDLRKANRKVQQAQASLDRQNDVLQTAKSKWDEAVERRKAVEKGQSLDQPGSNSSPAPTNRQPAAPGAGEVPTSEPAGPNTGAAPVARPAPNTHATPAGEAALKNLLALPAEAQLTALQQVPPEDRQSFLTVTNEYLRAGQADNYFGLDAEHHTHFAALQEPVAALRLNALLSWGDEAQSEYLTRVDQATRDEIQAHLNQQLFDQQLQAQAEALRARLQTGAGDENADAPAVTIPVGGNGQPNPTPGAAPVNGQPPPVAVTEPATGNPHLNPQSYRQLPAAEQLARFTALPDNQQDLLFSGLNLREKQDLLVQSAHQNNDVEQVTRLTSLMHPDEKQALANNIRTAQQETAGLPLPHNTAMSLILGQLAQQGVTPKFTPVAAEPTSPAAPPATPPRQGASLEIDDSPPAQPGPFPVPGVEHPPSQPPADNGDATVMLQQLLATNPQTGERFQAFSALPMGAKEAVFEVLETQKSLSAESKQRATQTQAEFLSGMAYMEPENPERQALIAKLPASSRAELAQNLQGTLAGIEASTQVSAADKAELLQAQTTLIADLSGPAPQAAADPVARPQVQIEGSDAPTTRPNLPAQPTAPVVTPAAQTAADGKGLELLQNLVALNPQTGERFQAFTGLSLADKQAVMAELENQKVLDPEHKHVAVQIQAEFLSGMAYLTPDNNERQALIRQLPAEAKNALVQNLQSTLSEIQTAEVLSAAERSELLQAQQTLIAELKGAPSAAPTTNPSRPGFDASRFAQELTQMPARADRQSTFAELSLADKKAVFSALKPEVKGEMLTALVHPHPNDAERQELIKGLSLQDKARLNTMLQESLQVLNSLGEQQAAANVQQVLQDLGQQVAPATGPEAGQAPEQVQPAAGPAPTQTSGPAAGKLDMSTQVNQLKAIVSERSMFGYGSVTNTEGMHQLIDQIWKMGTPANQQAMAKVLVEGKESQTLANLLANVTVSESDAVAVLTSPGFPGTRFMNDIDDPRAFIMLQYLGQAATQSDATGQKAQTLILDTVKEYTGTLWDREEPFKRMKNSGQGSYWPQLPANLRTAIDKLLR